MSLAVKDKDPISFEIEGDMIKSTGSSIARLKKRLKETNMTFQLKPPEDEKMEVWKWEQKINEMVDYKEKFDFPTVMEIKRSRAKKQQGLAETNAEKDRQDADRKAMHRALAKEANRKLNMLRVNKRFGKANTFGGPVEGENIKTIENYSGLNSIYTGERNIVRKNGVFTKQVGESEIPPWIGPQYYSNLDPDFLAKGLFPDSISQIPFKSATSSRNLIGRSAKELKDAKIIRREKLDSWKYKEPGPRYTRTPERLSPERLLRHHGYARNEDGKFIKEEDTVASTVYSQASDPRRATEQRPPLIVLGDLTRQLVMVEKEELMQSRLPLSKRVEIGLKGTSSTKAMAAEMLANATSYITTSNTLSAKLARHELAVKKAMDGGVVNGRIDYTRGALANIENDGARAEHTHPAPSITGSDNGTDMTSLISSKVTVDESAPEKPMLAADVTIASPVKRLLMVSKDTLSGHDVNRAEKLSEEEQAKEEAKAENARIAKIEEERKKAYDLKQRAIRLEYSALSPIQKSFSKRKLPLTSPIQPKISTWLSNPKAIYHRDKEPEFLAPALERKRQEMLAIPGIDQGKSASRHENVEDLYMPDSLRSEVKIREGLYDESHIEELYGKFAKDMEKQREEEEKARKVEAAVDESGGGEDDSSYTSTT